MTEFMTTVVALATWIEQEEPRYRGLDTVARQYQTFVLSKYDFSRLVLPEWADTRVLFNPFTNTIIVHEEFDHQTVHGQMDLIEQLVSAHYYQKINMRVMSNPQALVNILTMSIGCYAPQALRMRIKYARANGSNDYESVFAYKMITTIRINCPRL